MQIRGGTILHTPHAQLPVAAGLRAGRGEAFTALISPAPSGPLPFRQTRETAELYGWRWVRSECRYCDSDIRIQVGRAVPDMVFLVPRLQPGNACRPGSARA